MFGLGPTELIVILVLALLVLGPQRIPEAASSLGKAIRSFRRATRELKDQIDLDDEVRRPFEDLRSALRDEPQRPVFPPLITAPGEDTYPRIPIDEQMNGRGHISDAPPLPPEALPGAPLPASLATAPEAAAAPKAAAPVAATPAPPAAAAAAPVAAAPPDAVAAEPRK
ncbi:MAG: twin-arginine translocase TatA/TatE family subunit [Polyangia bacterium]